jgi:hypothetical protein
MAKYSINTKLKELLKDPDACAVLEIYMPGLTTSPRIKMASALSLKKVVEFPQVNLSKEQIAELDGKLQALG